MSAFNPFPFISGAQEASKGYSENRSLDDILKQSRQASSSQQQDDIMSQVLQRLPPEKQQIAMQFIQQKQAQMAKQAQAREYQRRGYGEDFGSIPEGAQ